MSKAGDRLRELAAELDRLRSPVSEEVGRIAMAGFLRGLALGLVLGLALGIGGASLL